MTERDIYQRECPIEISAQETIDRLHEKREVIIDKIVSLTGEITRYERKLEDNQNQERELLGYAARNIHVRTFVDKYSGLITIEKPRFGTPNERIVLSDEEEGHNI